MVLVYPGEEHLPRIVEINNFEAKWVGEKDVDFFRRFLGDGFFLAQQDAGRNPLGFILAMADGDDYESENFKWFQEHVPGYFAYIDRVVVDPAHRRKGIGRLLYEVIWNVRPVNSSVVCEVSVDPLNEESVRFHEAMGFEKMGEHTAYGHRCEMLIRK